MGSWGAWAWVGLVLVAAQPIVASAPQYQCFKFGKSEYAATIDYPGDIIREVGQSYVAHCLFDNTTIDVNDVYFMHWGKTPDKQYRLQHERVNSSAIRVNLTHDEMTSYGLKCLMNDTNNPKSPKFLCERTVKFGHKPQDVQNLTCISKNWVELNCSWVEPPNPVPVTYNLTYVVTNFQASSRCPESEFGKPWCFWPQERLGQKDDWILTFTANNSISSSTFDHKISVYASVIPNAAEKLSASVEGPHTVNLTWQFPHPINTFPGNITQEVSYREVPDGNHSQDYEWIVFEPEEVVPKRFLPNYLYSKTITKLYPYMQYDFRVRLHTAQGGLRKNMWSDAEVTTARTLATKPTEKPTTDIGTYETDRDMNSRDIYVYWKMIDPIFFNGPNFRYEIAIYNDDTQSQYHRGVPTVRSYFHFPNMQNDVNYRFEIWPVNDIGRGGENTKSVVRVPKTTELLDIPTNLKVIAYYNGTIYNVRWKITEEQVKNQDIESVTIYYCKRQKYENRCESKLNWIQLNDPLMLKKNLTDLEKSAHYLFGISLNSNTSSSGIRWISCIGSHGDRPPAISKLDVEAVSSTEVRLKWELDCNLKAAEPTGFNISYCPTIDNLTECSDEGDIKFVEVTDPGQTSAVISGLHPFTRYVVNIASQTEVGLSKWSKNFYQKTFQDKPSESPQSPHAVAKGQSWVTLSWEPPRPDKRNGVIVQYQVTSEPFVKIPPVVVTNSSAIVYANVSGLDAYTQYRFNIFACTEWRDVYMCSDDPTSVAARTSIGVPGKVESVYVNADILQWNHDDCNGPACSYEIHYGNSTTETSLDKTALNLEELGVHCDNQTEKLNISIRAVSDATSSGVRYKGPWMMETVSCPQPGIMPWWLILIIAFICIIATTILVAVCSFGRSKVKQFLLDCNREIELPSGLGPKSPVHDELNHSAYRMVRNQVIDDWGTGDIHVPAKKTPFPSPEEQELIPDKARQSRNPSGDSGTSENDPVDSSGCSTGSESDSSSGSHRVPQSSDSGTGTEIGFSPESKNWGSGSLRQRTPVPSYVTTGLPQDMGNTGYVSLGSVPNIPSMPVGSIEDGLSLQQSSSSLAMGSQPLGARRASTGYISMPDTDTDAVNVPLEMLGNVTLPHDNRPGGFPAYSRHSFLPKKSPATDNSPYIKTGSLQRLNAGYVAVAQPDGGVRGMSPEARGLFGNDQMGYMKRQSSLSALPLSNNKSLSTPDEELPPGTYCRVGARGSPSPPSGPSPGYVSIAQPTGSAPQPMPIASPTNLSPYVPYDVSKAIPSPSPEPDKGTGGYVSVGSMAEGRWAHPVISTEDFEEGREVSSAPLEGTRSRPTFPTRPNTSEATINHKGPNRFAPLGPSLSKQSSGYVSQDSLPIHDPVVMSPKRLLTQSKEPYSMIMPTDYKGTAV